MRERSLAGKTLALLPIGALVAWSGNAALTRMRHERRGTGPEQLEFVVGSMDDTIMETLETGDVIFFSRKLTALQPLAALYTWVARKHYNPRFDHCGWIYVDKLGRKFVVEETLAKVQCRPFSARILTSESNEIAVLPLKVERTKEFQDAAFRFVSENVNRPSRISLRHLAAALIDPQGQNGLLSPPSSEDAPLFPSAALVAEAYDALGLVDKDRLTADATPLSAANVTPRALVARNKIQFRPDTNAKFGSIIPIRLY